MPVTVAPHHLSPRSQPGRVRARARMPTRYTCESTVADPSAQLFGGLAPLIRRGEGSTIGSRGRHEVPSEMHLQVVATTKPAPAGNLVDRS